MKGRVTALTHFCGLIPPTYSSPIFTQFISTKRTPLACRDTFQQRRGHRIHEAGSRRFPPVPQSGMGFPACYTGSLYLWLILANISKEQIGTGGTKIKKGMFRPLLAWGFGLSSGPPFSCGTLKQHETAAVRRMKIKSLQSSPTYPNGVLTVSKNVQKVELAIDAVAIMCFCFPLITDFLGPSAAKPSNETPWKPCDKRVLSHLIGQNWVRHLLRGQLFALQKKNCGSTKRNASAKLLFTYFTCLKLLWPSRCLPYLAIAQLFILCVMAWSIMKRGTPVSLHSALLTPKSSELNGYPFVAQLWLPAANTTSDQVI